MLKDDMGGSWDARGMASGGGGGDDGGLAMGLRCRRGEGEERERGLAKTRKWEAETSR